MSCGPANLLAHQRDPAGIDIILSQELPDVSRIVRRGQARITPAVALIERIQLFKHLLLQVRADVDVSPPGKRHPAAT